MQTTSVLVLNRHYQPVHVTSVKRAFTLLYMGAARVVEPDFSTFDFVSWAELGAASGDEALRLLQQEDDFPAQDFCEAMLTAFTPLAGKFENHQHPFCGGYKVLRVKNEDENVKIAIPTEYIRYVGGQDLDLGSLTEK